MNKILQSLCLLTLSAILAACGSSSGGSADADEASGVTAASGAGVKGPLVGAMVMAYKLDTLRADLKGELVAQGSTNSTAQLQLDIPDEFAAQGPFLVEYSGGSELGGSTPVIERLTTILTSAQLVNNTPVYATPLSTLAIEHAAAIADKIDGPTTDPLTDDLAGDNDGVVSANEFLSALTVSARNIKSTLGLGLLDEDIDLFSTSPLLGSNSDPQDTLAIRTANEVFAAIVKSMNDEITNSGLGVSGADVLSSLAQDFSDGAFDKSSNGQPIAALNRVNDIEATITADPTQLNVPGTNTPVTAINTLLKSESATLDPENTPQDDLDPPDIETPDVSVYDDTTPPDPDPDPNSAPIVIMGSPSGNHVIEEGQGLGVQITVNDVDGNLNNCRLSLNGQLVRQLSSAPFAWGTLSSNNDAILNNMLAGTYAVVATCSDDEGLSTSASFLLQVNEPDQPEPPTPDPVPPQVSLNAPASINEGESFSVVATATDSDGTISGCMLNMDGTAVGNDTGAPYSWETSNFTRLANIQPGSHQLQVSCTDNSGLSTTASDTIIVNTVVQPIPPVVSFSNSANATIAAGSDYPITVNASDADGTIAQCTLSTNGSAGRAELAAPYTWTPSQDPELNDMPEGSYTFVASCTDNSGLSAQASLQLTVEAAANSAPSVSFSAPANQATYTEGDPVSVSISASDSDGSIAACSLEIDGQSVRTDTVAPYAFGANSGFADAALANLGTGSYTLTASCSDDEQQSNSATISITIEAAPPNVNYSDVTLSWSIPTTREDGTALPIAEIDSYEIYYYPNGSSIGSGEVVPVAAQTPGGSMVSEQLISSIPTGNYWFTIITIDTDGNFSDIGTPVQVDIP